MRIRSALPLLLLLVVTTGCGAGQPAPPDGAPAPPDPRRSFSDTTPSATQPEIRAALAAASALGPGWSGPTAVSEGFGSIDNIAQSCSLSQYWTDRDDETRPRHGVLASYDHDNPDTVLNRVQVMVGVDTADRAKTYLEFLPKAMCVTGKIRGYSFRRWTGPPRPLGDQDLTVHTEVDLPGEPLAVETGFVRLGGLVVAVYGSPKQVDAYLPVALAAAQRALAGKVAGV